MFDLDDGGGADRPWRDRMLDLVAQHGPLPATKITTTPSGGRHAFYRWPADVPIPAGDELFGFTVRWPGRGYLVGPGSRIGDREYTAGPVTEIADLPAALGRRRGRRAARGRGHAAARGRITVTGGFALPDRIPSGRRYAAVRDYVASRYNAGLGLDELWELVRTQVAPRFEVAKTEAELRADFDRVTAKIGERLGAPARAPAPAPVDRRRSRRARSTPPTCSSSTSRRCSGSCPTCCPRARRSSPARRSSARAASSTRSRSRSPSAASCSAAGSSRATSCTSRSRTASGAARRASGPPWATAPCPAAGSRSAGPPRSSARASSEELLDWLDEHPDARLVAIDTLQRVRARGDARRNAYEVDVEDLARLQDIFKDRAVGLLIVHHSKKDAGDDFLASVSGTYGITGSADTTLVIQRKRLETFGKLVVTGRDVQEVEEPVQFNGMTWSSAPRSLAEASFEQAEVYKVIEAEGPIFPKAIADLIGSTREAVQQLVEKLVAGGSVARARGGYVVARVRIAEEAEEAERPKRA